MFNDYKTREDRMGEYDTNTDRILLLGVLTALIISITLILWTPDVEAIGQWVYNLIH